MCRVWIGVSLSAWWGCDSPRAAPILSREAVRVSSVKVPAYKEDKAAFNRVKEAMGADWVKNEFHSFVIQMASKVEAAQVATPPSNEVVGVENEGVEEEVRYEAVAEKEEVKKEADSEVAEPEAVVVEFEPEAIAKEVEVSVEVVAVRELLLLPAVGSKGSRRSASILAEHKIASIYEKEDDKDNEDANEDWEKLKYISNEKIQNSVCVWARDKECDLVDFGGVLSFYLLNSLLIF